MYYLVNVDHNGNAAHPVRNEYVGFKKCCISKTVDDDILWNGS